MVYKLHTTESGVTVKIFLRVALPVLALLLISFSAFAEQNFKIKSIWYSKLAPSEKSFFVVVEDRDHYYSGDKVLVFGKNGELSTTVEYFTIFGLNFYTSSGNEFNAMSDSRFMSGRILLKNKLIRVKYEKSINSVTEFTYSRIQSDNIDGYAKKAIFNGQDFSSYYRQL